MKLFSGFLSSFLSSSQQHDDDDDNDDDDDDDDDDSFWNHNQPRPKHIKLACNFLFNTISPTLLKP